MPIKKYDPKTAKKALSRGALLVDVRDASEVEAAAYDVKGMFHIPMGELEKRWRELPKQKEIVVACAVGARSMLAAGFLAKQGFESLANLEGGINAWEEAGLPVVLGKDQGESTGGCCGGAESKADDAEEESCCGDSSDSEECCDESKESSGSKGSSCC
jgi:rhodanese-related sulfurtransferase